MEFSPLTTTNVSFGNATVIFPCVTHGNVGQLAADLLIFNLKLKPIGVLYHPDVLPICGADPFSETCQGSPASSLEIYANEDVSLVVAQQRGEVIKGCQRKFAREVTSWLKTSMFKNVVLLASLPSTVGENDSQIGGTKWRMIQTPNLVTESYPKAGVDGESNKFSEHKYRNSRVPIPALEFEQIPEDLKNRRIPPWTFVYECIKQTLTTQFLVALCSEGDNSVDADRMASRALEMIDNAFNTADLLLPTNELRWATPPSWKRVYGSLIKRSVFA